MKDEVCLYRYFHTLLFVFFSMSISNLAFSLPQFPILYPTSLRINSHFLYTRSKEHIPTVKKELQELTASEPLSLSEEYAMQRSWRQDPDKLTFIACLPPTGTSSTITPTKEDAPSAMLGDINLFLFDDDDDEEDAASDKASTSILGEIELMIAVKSEHRKGHGRAALLAFLHYILTNTSPILDEYTKGKQADLRYLRVKINKENVKSISLFESVGFVRTSAEANYFGEVELRLQVLGNANVLGDLEKVKGWSEKPLVVRYGEV